MELKWYYPMISIFFALLLLALCQWADGKVLTAFIVGAVLFILFTLVLIGLIVWESWAIERREMVISMSDFARNLAPLDDAKMEVFSYQFPHIRYRSRGRIAKPLFEDTDVPMAFVHLFLQDSNDYYIAPQRDWQGKERPEWAWIQIYKWLVDHKMIIPNSAAGNTSHHWIADSYKRMMADYWMAGKTLTNVEGLEGFFSGVDAEPEEGEGEPGPQTGTQQAYAYTTKPLPHLGNTSGRG